MSSFQNRYNNLNEAQRKAVDIIEGPVLVIAGPGSGKTELLSVRVANILRLTDTLPSSILCLTFTDAAAVNMRQRLAGLIGPEAYKVAIHTFHSFGSEIISQNQEFFYKGAQYSPANELIQIQIIEDILRDQPHTSNLNSYHPAQGYTYLRDILSRIGELKKAGITPDEYLSIMKQNQEFLAKASPLITEVFAERMSKKIFPLVEKLLTELNAIPSEPSPLKNITPLKEVIIAALSQAYNDSVDLGKATPLSQWKKDHTKKDKEKRTVLKDSETIEKHVELSEIYKKYHEALHHQGYYDYDDMILDTVHTLETTPELRYNVQEKFLYVLVDEFQDTSGVQMRLLDTLFDPELNENRPNILAVGDDDQAIFKFQGANIDNILNFHKKYNSPEIVVLTKNYRSTQPILDFVRPVITQGVKRLENLLPDQITKKLSAGNTSLTLGNLTEHEFPTSFHELVWLTEAVQEKIAQGIPPQEIAVIAPKHRILEEAAKFLDYFKIPVSYERKQNLFEHPHIKELITILKFIHSVSQKNEATADDLLPEILSFPCWNLSRLEIWNISTKAFENRTSWLTTMQENPATTTLAHFLITLGVECHEKTAEEIIDMVTGVTSATINEQEFTSPYKEFYFNSDKFQNQQHLYIDLLQSLQSFVNAIREHKGSHTLSVADVIEFVTLHETHNLPLTYISSFNNEEKSINLLTAHKSKGLEFDTVFVLNCQDDIWVKGGKRDKLKFPQNIPLSPEAENDDDKLRLFYVTLTRAKRNLHLSYHTHKDNGKEQNKLRFLESDSEQESPGHQFPEKIKALQKDFAEKKNITNLLELKFSLNNYHPHTTDENELLKQLINNYKLSVTHLNNFLNIIDAGPQTFLEQNLLRFPQMQNAASAYGSAVHLALHNFHTHYLATKNIPTCDFLLEQFTHSLNAQRLNQRDLKTLQEKGVDHLTTYYQKRSEAFSLEDHSEFNFKTQNVVVDHAHITGKIDKFTPNNETHNVIVYDYKTGKPLTNWNAYQAHEKLKSWKYRNQLIFYKLLVEHARDFKGKFQVNEGVLEFVDPYKEEIKVLSLDITHEDYNRMRQLVNAVYKKIVTLDFPDTSNYDQSVYGIEAFENDLIAGLI